jgi:hypothetical protein
MRRSRMLNLANSEETPDNPNPEESATRGFACVVYCKLAPLCARRIRMRVSAI